MQYVLSVNADRSMHLRILAERKTQKFTDVQAVINFLSPVS